MSYAVVTCEIKFFQGFVDVIRNHGITVRNQLSNLSPATRTVHGGWSFTRFCVPVCLCVAIRSSSVLSNSFHIYLCMYVYLQELLVWLTCRPQQTKNSVHYRLPVTPCQCDFRFDLSLVLVIVLVLVLVLVFQLLFSFSFVLFLIIFSF